MLIPNLSRAYLTLAKTRNRLTHVLAYMASTTLPGSSTDFHVRCRDDLALEYRALLLEMRQLAREANALEATS